MTGRRSFLRTIVLGLVALPVLVKRALANPDPYVCHVEPLRKGYVLRTRDVPVRVQTLDPDGNCSLSHCTIRGLTPEELETMSRFETKFQRSQFYPYPDGR